MEDKEIRYALEDGAFVTKGKYYLPTTFFEKFHVPKSKEKWTYSFVKCNGTKEKDMNGIMVMYVDGQPMMKFIQLYIFTKIGN